MKDIKITEDIQNNIDNYYSNKEKLINSILNSDKLTSFDKIELIETHNLFGVTNSIEDPFREKYEDDAAKYLHVGNGKSYSTDNLFGIMDFHDRYAVLNITDIIDTYDDLKEYFVDEFYTDQVLKDDLEYVPIYTIRNHHFYDKPIAYFIPFEEFVEHLTNWVFKNRVIGITYDW